MQSGANVIEFPIERVNQVSMRIMGQTALVLILPVVRIERCDVDTIQPDRARRRRAWYTMKRRLKEGTLLTSFDGS